MNTIRLTAFSCASGGRRSVGSATPATRRSAALQLIGLAALALAFTAGCAHRAPRVTTLQPQPIAPENATAMDPALLNPPPKEFTLGPGDRLDLELLDDPASRVTTTVGPDGKIYFYLLPGIDVWGLTLPQVRERLEQGMQEYFREKRPISVALRSSESQRVWMLGRVNKPGVYPLSGNMTLLEALASADGPASATPGAAVGAALGLGNVGQVMDDSSDLRRAFVMRNGQRLPVDLDRLLNRGDLSQNIRLQGGDFIYLPTSGGSDVSVLGAVGTARVVPYERDMTLVQAVANAGGTIQDAFVRQVAVVRGSLTEPQIAVVDYEAIVLGRAPDVRLEPQDIVYVPYTPYRTLKRYVNLILDTFVRATGVNEGARAIDPNILPPGISVPVVTP
jgi:protein involved in polysaccharide export with SLBB domain